MVQAARSGTQNIAEGSEASGTSKKIEIKLTGIARASLVELRQDYEDFLRHRELSLWTREDARREDLFTKRLTSRDQVKAWIQEVCDREKKEQVAPVTDPEVAANAVLLYITVALKLLARQIQSQAAMFEKEGGFTERLYNARSARRKRS